MANIATLTVTLSANSSRLVSEFNRAQRRSRTFSDRMRGTLRVVGRAFAGMAVTAAGALGTIAVAGIRAGDQLEKTAQKLGTTATALAGLRFAAQQTGVETRQLDLGLQRMTRRVAEAAQGAGEAKGAIAELGLSARELVQLSPEQQMLALADAFEGVENSADRVRLGFKLFDSEGVALINTLGRGREELERLVEESEKFGLGLSAVQSRNVQEAADAFGRARAASEGFSRQLGAALAPAFEAAANSAADFVARLTNSIPRIKAFASAIGLVRQSVNDLTQREIQAEIRALNERVRTLRGLSGRNARNAQAEIEETIARIDALAEQYKALERAKADAANQDGLGVVTPSLNGPLQQFARQQRLDAFRRQFQETNQILDETVRRIETLESAGQSIFQQTRTPIENFIDQMAEARDLLARGLLPGGEDTFNRYREQLLNGLVEPLAEVGEGARRAFSQMTEFGVQAARNIQSQFAQFLFDPFQDGLSGMLKGFADTLRRMAAEVAASAILREFFSLFANSNNAFGAIARDFLGRRVSGGPVNAMQPYWVGESGRRELFVPQTAGNVIPENRLGGGGGGVEVHIHNAPPDTQTKSRSLGGRTIVDVLLPPLMQDLSENGPLSRAIGNRFGLRPALGGR